VAAATSEEQRENKNGEAGRALRVAHEFPGLGDGRWTKAFRSTPYGSHRSASLCSCVKK
jgi:hypothetical protein